MNGLAAFAAGLIAGALWGPEFFDWLTDAVHTLFP